MRKATRVWLAGSIEAGLLVYSLWLLYSLGWGLLLYFLAIALWLDVAKLAE